MFTVSSRFVGDFKIGDNINHNLATVRLFYELCDDGRLTVLLRKPIIVTLVSIAEAMLYDFISRIQSREHTTTLSRKTIAELREKDYSNMTNLISGARALDLFSADDDFYAQIDELRKLRNRVHIQNEKDHFERDEAKAFSAARQRSAEQVLEYIAKFLSLNHPRKTTTHGFVGDFEFPWREHWEFEDDEGEA